MPSGFDDLARIMSNPFERGSHVIRRVLQDRMPAHKIDALLDELDKCWEQNKTTVQLIGEEVLKVLPLIDPQSARSKAVLQSLRTIESRSPYPRRAGYDFSGIWPMEMAGFAVDAGLHPHFEVFPDGRGGSPVDLFLEPRPGGLIHPGYQPLSERTTAVGIVVPGIAIECKAIESARKACKNFKKALTQIKPFGSGLVAFDVSSVIVDELAQGSTVGHDEFVGQCGDIHARLHQKIAQQLPLLVKELPWIRQRFAGFLVHAHVFSRERPSLGNEPSRQLTVYRRVYWSPNPEFNLWNTSTPWFMRSRVNAFMDYMFRNCRCWEHVDPGEGKVYVLRDNGESMSMGFGPNCRALVERHAKEAENQADQ